MGSMLRISRKVDYGLLLLSALSVTDKRRVGLRSLAEEYQVPYRFLSRIASELAAAGLVKSKVGVKGGYRLARRPEEISFYEVVKVLEGELELVECLKGGRDCGCKVECFHKQGMKRLGAGLIEVMKKTTMVEMMELEGRE